MSAFDTYRAMRDSTLRNGERARDEMRQVGQQNVLMAAGQSYAAGDTAGASNQLAVNGMLPEALQLDQSVRSNANADIAAGRATEDRQRSTVLAGAQGLMRLPETQWMEAFTGQVAPALQEVGLGHLVPQIAQDGITRQELEAVIASLGGEVASPYANDRAGGDGIIVRPDATGNYQPVYTPPVDPLDVEYRRAQIEAARASAGQRQAAAERARRPPAARGGGRSGGGGGRSGGGASGRPWENY